MTDNINYASRLIAGCLVMSLAAPLAEAATLPLQQASSGQQLAAPPSSTQSQDPDGPVKQSAADSTQPEKTAPVSPGPAQSQTSSQSGQSATPAFGSEQPQTGTQKPVGTAAAPYEKTTGVAASRPAGAVIAPAKQRRAHSILIRVGVVVGAAVAIGTVFALTRGSPSRPN